jgi:Zn-dependent protease with chaperone function
MKHLLRYALFTCLLLVLSTQPIFAQDETPRSRADEPFEQQLLERLGALNPQAVPIFVEATTRWDAGELPAARQGFEEVLRMVPDFPDALRRLSNVELALGDRQSALAHAQRAFEIDPIPINESNLAYALLYQQDTAQNFEAFKHAQAAAQAEPDDDYILSIWLLTAGAVQDDAAMRQAAKQLVSLDPESALGFYYLGLADAQDKRWERAERELLRAQELGFPADTIQEVMDLGVRRQAQIYRAGRYSLYAIGIWLLALLALFGVGAVLSRMTLRAIQRPPRFTSATAGQPTISRGENWVRRIYQVVIALVSSYFYLSIPFLIFVVIALAAAVVYLFLVIGYIPLQGVIILGLMVLYTLAAILRSIFTRRRDAEPGRPLPPEEAPELWGLAEQVAKRLETRAVDAIYITPGTDIAVVERGGAFKKLRGKGQRCLILGAGVLPALSQGQFQAILAHEYGHFSNRDTAGGNIANQVQASLMHMAYRLASSGQARWYNPVWLFVNGYHRAYSRITLGASRLQEILADRFAVLAYGAEDFKAGLKNIIQQSVQFDLRTHRELAQAVESDTRLHNLYQLSEIEGSDYRDEVEKKIKETLEHPTSPYDSHPGYQDRLKYVAMLPSSPYLQGSSAPVTDLIPNYLQLQEEMTAQVQANLDRRYGTAPAAEQPPDESQSDTPQA